jgi:tetratricopeptide (TPR) repeat protein
MKTFIKKALLSLVILFSLLSSAYTQTVKEMFEKSWSTEDTTEKRTLRIEIAKNSPDSEYGLFCKAWLMFENDKSGAIDLYTQAIKIKQNFWEAYYNRGWNYNALKKYSEAISDYTKSIEINPDYDKAYANRGRSYFEFKKYSEAISDFTKAIEINSNDKLYYYRGTTYAFLEEYTKAVSDFTKAIEINPNLEDAYYNRGVSYSRMGDELKSQSDLKKYETVKKNNKPKETEILLEQFKIVADKYRSLSSKPELSEEARKYAKQAEVLKEDKKYKEAIELNKKIIDIDETYPPAHFNLALLSSQIKDYETAIIEMKKYLMLVPDASNARAAQDKIYEWEAKIEK